MWMGWPSRLPLRRSPPDLVYTPIDVTSYNDEDWDKQTIAGLLHMGDPSLDYAFPDDPPDKLTDKDVWDAIDRIFERAGI